MSQTESETQTTSRKRARRVVLNEKNIMQKLALKSRTVAGRFERDKVDGAVNVTFLPDEGRASQFRFTAEQAKELREWLDDTSRYEV